MSESRNKTLTHQEGEDLKRRIRELESETERLRAVLADRSGGTADNPDSPNGKRAADSQYKQVAELLDASADAIISVDGRGAINRFNRGAETIFGYRSSEIIGRPLDVLIPERFRHSHRTHMASFGRATGRSRLMNERGEIFGLRKDGQEFPAEASIVRLKNGGRPQFTVILRDITERKKAEAALRERETQLRQARKTAYIGAFVWDDVGDFCEYCSDELAEILGLTPDALIELSKTPEWIHGRIHPDDRENYLKTVAEAQETAVPYDIEFQFLRADGNLLRLRELGEPETDAEGRVIRTFGTIQDITQIRHAEDSLRQNEALLSQAQKLAKLGAYVWDNVTDVCVNCSEELAALLGVTPERFMKEFGTADGYLAAVCEEDRELLRLAMRNAMEHAVPYDIEYRIRTAAGDWRHFRETTELVYDSEGRNVRTFGTVQDVTHLRETEAARLRSEEQFRDLIESSIQGVMIFRDLVPIFANQAAANIFGYDNPDEITRLESLHCLIAPEERERIDAITKARIENRKAPAQYEFQGLRKDGSRIWLENRGSVVTWDGEPAILSVMVDITERHMAQIALQESERQLRTITDNLPAFIAYTDKDSCLRFANRTVEEWYGGKREELVGKHASELLGEQGSEQIHSRIVEILSGKTVRKEELRSFPDGRSRYVDNTSVPNIGPDGKVQGWFTLITDITERKLAEEALRQREEQLRAITDNIPAFVCYIDRDLYYRFANRVAEKWYDRPSTDICNRHATEIIGAEAVRKLQPQFDAVLAGKSTRFEEIRRFPDGSERHLDLSYVPDAAEDGTVRGFFALLLDITKRRQAEDALRRSMRAAELLREIATAANHSPSAEHAMSHCLEAIGSHSGWNVANVFVLADDDSGDMAPAGLWWADAPGEFRDFRHASENIRFAPGEGLPGRVAASRKPAWIERIDSEENFPRAELTGSLEVASGFAFPVMVGQKVAAVLEFFSREIRPRDDDLMDVANQAGTLLGRVIERQRAARELREREEQIRLMTDNVPVLITYIRPDKKFGFVNKTTEEWYARPAADLIGRSIDTLIGKAEFGKMEPKIDRALAGETLHFDEILSYPDGKVRHIDATYVPHFDAQGNVRGIFTMVADVTERIHAEEQLRQAQRMEAIGKLTGGVAHDFNNLLAVIMGNMEMVHDHLGDSNPAVRAITNASQRGAALTQRLLAFSRQQPLRPQATDMAGLCQEMAAMLSRTLGESVRIETDVPQDSWPAMVDSGELENAILNLAINARDAMPAGGTLTLESRNIELGKDEAAQHEDVSAGDYVRLSVRDTGAGMSPDVLEHAFEPFYTTKRFGKGSGLGLSMVYGFTTQSGGFATIESECGVGTSVHLYLPRAGQCEGSKQEIRQPCVSDGDGETILVVEDDPDVRRLTVTLLSAMKYKVVQAEDGESAMPIIRGKGKIDLLLSDVVLPGDMSGPAIAEEALQRRPRLPVLFMSGYAEDVIRRDREGGDATVDADLLTKPFTRAQLGEKVKAALGLKSEN